MNRSNLKRTLKRLQRRNESRVRIYLTDGGNMYVRGEDLAQNPAWREKVRQLIAADLTGKNQSR